MDDLEQMFAAPPALVESKRRPSREVTAAQFFVAALDAGWQERSIELLLKGRVPTYQIKVGEELLRIVR